MIEHRQYYSRLLAAMIALLTVACAAQTETTPARIAPTQNAALNDGPPLENGVYVAHGICIGSEFECNDDPRQAVDAIAVHESLDPNSGVIAMLAPGAQFTPLEGQLRFVPRRGLVHTAMAFPDGRRLEIGDVVFMLEPGGEGTFHFWRRGEDFWSDWTEGDSIEPITWEPEPAIPPGAVTGEWVRVRMQDGRTGWIGNARTRCAEGYACGPEDRM